MRPLSQSLRALEIQRNVSVSKTFGNYFHQFRSVLEKLDLQDQAMQYYATWVHKAKLTQLQQFPNPHKRYLHLLAYLKHQYFDRQDVLMDIFQKCVTAVTNQANRQQIIREQKMQSVRREAIQSINISHKKSRHLLAEIRRVIQDTDLCQSEQVAKIEQLFTDHESLNDETTALKLQHYEKVLDEHTDGEEYYIALERRSLSLQRRVAAVMKAIEFDTDSSIEPLLTAVIHFQATDGNIGHSPPFEFLREKERRLVGDGDSIRTSLYKILLFKSVAEAVKAGKLNLRYSYRYRAIQDYLIPAQRWQADRDRMLTLAGLDKFSNGTAYLAELKATLDDTYQSVNQQFHEGSNTHLSVDDFGYTSVRTPATDYSERGFIGSLLTKRGLMPVLQVLRDINNTGNFVDCFKHLSRRCAHVAVQNGKILLFRFSSHGLAFFDSINRCNANIKMSCNRSY